MKKALASLTVAALCSTFFVTTPVFGAPTQTPNDTVYVTPTFKSLKVNESVTVGKNLNVTEAIVGNLLKAATELTTLKVTTNSIITSVIKAAVAAAGVKVDSDLTVTGKVTVAKDLKVSGNANIDGGTTVTGTLKVKEAATLDKALTVGGDTNVGKLKASNSTTIEGDLTANKDIVINNGGVALNATDHTGNVTNGLKGSVTITSSTGSTDDVAGVASDGAFFTDGFVNFGPHVAFKIFLSLSHILTAGNVVSFSDMWAKGTGTFAAGVRTPVIQNPSKNLDGTNSDPVVIRDDLRISASANAGDNNPGNLIVDGYIKSKGDIKAMQDVDVQGGVNVTGSVGIDNNLYVDKTAKVKDLYISGNLGSGLVNVESSGSPAISAGGVATRTASCPDKHYLMTHCGYRAYKYVTFMGVSVPVTANYLNVAYSYVTRNTSDTDVCTVTAFNNDSASRYFKAQASCLDLTAPSPSFGFGGFIYNPGLIDWTLLATPTFTVTDYTKLTTPVIPLDFTQDFQTMPNPVLPGDGWTDPLPMMGF